MRILIAHVRYRQRGGEDVVVDTEAALLRAAGHDVAVLDPSSQSFDWLPLATKLQIGLSAGDHRYGRRLVREAILAHRPDVVHFHNLYPLLGPGAIAEAASLGCATVQTLHNYRLSCLAGTHFRNGVTCEQCAPGCRGCGVAHGCYRQSRVQSWSMAGALDVQWAYLATHGLPHVEVCLTEYMHGWLLGLGARAETLVIKPNSVRPTACRMPFADRSGAVFVGRLSVEKGIQRLVDAWPADAPILKVIGGGPLEAVLHKSRCNNVVMTGPLSADDVRRELASASVCVIPSMCAEGLPTVALESFAEGTPVVGFDFGAVGSVIREQGAGMSVPFLDWDALVDVARHWCNASAGAWNERSDAALEVYRARFSHEANVSALSALYHEALRRGSQLVAPRHPSQVRRG